MNIQKLIADSILSDIQTYCDISQLRSVIQVNTNHLDLYNLIVKTQKTDDHRLIHTTLKVVYDERGDTDWPASCRFIGTNIKHSNANHKESHLVYADFSNNYGLDGAIDVINNVFTYVAYIAVHKPSLDSEAQSAAFYQILNKKGLSIKHIPIDENTQVVRLINDLYTTEEPVRHSQWGGVARPQWVDGGYSFEFFPWGNTPANSFIENTRNISRLVRYSSAERSKYSLKQLSPLEIVATTTDVFKMEGLYRSERESIINCFKQLDTLSATTMNEVGIRREDMEGRLNGKLEWLNIRFWDALFKHIFDTEGLFTTKAKKSAMDQVFGSQSEALKYMPFSAENAKFFTNYLYDILKKNFISDFLSLVECLISPMNVTPYTSNPINLDDVEWPSDEHWVTKEKRHMLGHCKINTKIVSTELYGRRIGYDKYDISYGRVSRDINNILLNTVTLAQQVGITNIQTDGLYDNNGRLRSRIDVLSANGDCKEPVFSATLYKNGKLHLKLSDEFALRLNILLGKSKGWLSNVEQAYTELNITKIDYEAFELIYHQLP